MIRKGLVCIFLALSACVTQSKPLEEYVLARAAIEAARQIEASRYSPGFWSQAEESYKKAQEFYANRDYSLARDFFLKSKVAAEKAENSSRLIRQKNGEVL